MIRKVLIANRGEIALRILRACKLASIRTVAVYSRCDANLLHVRLADEAVCIGDNAPQDSYMNASAILAAAELTGACAIHPGYGFLAESSDFAHQVVRSGLIFIGPSPEVIAQMGDKVTAIATMKRLGIPCVPGSNGPLPNDADQQKKIAQSIGYPVLVKASGGGGGRAMAVVRDADSLIDAVLDVQREAKTCFGNDCVYLERYLENPRHVEVQILADHLGRVYCLGDRDCSVQRRRQKIIEEAPAFDIPEATRRELHTLCEQACEQLGYLSAGTLEFLYENGTFYFIEMNTRVQVEHPVTEMVTGIDIISAQLAIHSNRPLGFLPKDVRTRGVAIECRVNAEHPSSFIPSPGEVTVYHPPSGPNIRVDSHLYQQYYIPHYYDPLVAKIVAFDVDRTAAIMRLRCALDECVILGVDTNIAYLKKILASKCFQQKSYSIHFTEQFANGVLA